MVQFQSESVDLKTKRFDQLNFTQSLSVQAGGGDVPI